MSDALIVGSTNVVELTGLLDTVTGLYPTDAGVTVDILNQAGAVVSGAGPITLAYVATTTGATTLYRGVIPSTAALVNGATYTRRITAVGAGGIGTRIFTKEIVASLE